MKKYIILCSIVVVLLVISFGYMNIYTKDESSESEEIEVEIGKMNVYTINKKPYTAYYNELLKQSFVYVKGRVKSIDKSYEVFDVVEISDDSNGEVLTVYKNTAPAVDVGDIVYVFGQIKYDYEDDNGCHYYIDTTEETELEPYISVEADENEYMIVSEAVEKGNMIYEETFLEVEGTFDVSYNKYDYKYRLLEDTWKFKLIMDDNLVENLNLEAGEKVVITAKITGENDLLRVQEIRRK